MPKITIIWTFFAQYLRIKCARKLQCYLASALGFKSLSSWSLLHPLMLAFNPSLIQSHRRKMRPSRFSALIFKMQKSCKRRDFFTLPFSNRFRINNAQKVKSHVSEDFSFRISIDFCFFANKKIEERWKICLNIKIKWSHISSVESAIELLHSAFKSHKEHMFQHIKPLNKVQKDFYETKSLYKQEKRNLKNHKSHNQPTLCACWSS